MSANLVCTGWIGLNFLLFRSSTFRKVKIYGNSWTICAKDRQRQTNKQQTTTRFNYVSQPWGSSYLKALLVPRELPVPQPTPITTLAHLTNTEPSIPLMTQPTLLLFPLACQYPTPIQGMLGHLPPMSWGTTTLVNQEKLLADANKQRSINLLLLTAQLPLRT